MSQSGFYVAVVLLIGIVALVALLWALGVIPPAAIVLALGAVVNGGYSPSRRHRWRHRWERLRSGTRQWLLEDKAGVGLGGPPNKWQHIDVRQDRPWAGHGHNVSAQFHNDAGEVFIREWWDGEDGDLRFSLDVRAFRQLAAWYLWRWAWGEWFGLRRRLYYWDLRRRLDRQLNDRRLRG